MSKFILIVYVILFFAIGCSSNSKKNDSTAGNENTPVVHSHGGDHHS